MAKFSLGDRVRRSGSSDVHTIDEVVDLAGVEVHYWTLLSSEIPTRVFVKESELNRAE